MTLTAIVLAVWTVLSGPRPLSKDATDTADAIAQAVADDDRAPIGGSKEYEAALEAIYAFAESGAQRHPKPVSWDAKAGISCGMWQMPCQIVRNIDLWDQAKYWLYMMHTAIDACPRHPGAMMCGSCRAGLPRRMANYRWRKAKTVLQRVMAAGTP